MGEFTRRLREVLEFVAVKKTTVLGMRSKELQPDWLSLHVALAWILTRDYAFTYQVARFANPNLGNALALYNYSADKKAVTVVENEFKAWLLLREEISKKSVSARGMPNEKPFVEGRALAGPEKKVGILEFEEAELARVLDDMDELDRLESGIDLAQKKIELPPSEVSNLVIEVDSLEMHLRPETVVLSGGKWWRDVEISRDHLIMAFPVAQPASAPHAQLRGYRLKQTMNALNCIYPPNGLPVGDSELDCWEKVNKWFSEKKQDDKKMPVSGWVSKPTIRRAKKLLRSKLQSS
jgi:hypothetical protein